MRRRHNLNPWITGIMLASLMFLGFILFNMLLYSGSDDAPILRYYMGFEGGEPTTFSALVHPAMGWLLYGLAKLFPGVAWFSILQLFFLWFSSVVVIKSLMRCAALHGRSQWIGAVLGALTVAAGAFWISMRVSFTTTAAWLGAAAVVQLASRRLGAGRQARRPPRTGAEYSAAVVLLFPQAGFRAAATRVLAAGARGCVAYVPQTGEATVAASAAIRRRGLRGIAAAVDRRASVGNPTAGRTGRIRLGRRQQQYSGLFRTRKRQFPPMKRWRKSAGCVKSIRCSPIGISWTIP